MSTSPGPQTSEQVKARQGLDQCWHEEADLQNPWGPKSGADLHIVHGSRDKSFDPTDSEHISTSQVSGPQARDDHPHQSQTLFIAPLAASGLSNPHRRSSAPEGRFLPSKGLNDIGNLSLNQDLRDNPSKAKVHEVSSGLNPLKRAAEGHAGLAKKVNGPPSAEHDRTQTRHGRMRSAGLHDLPGHLGPVGHGANAFPGKNLPSSNPGVPLKSSGARIRPQDRPSQMRRVYDRRSHVFRPKLDPSHDKPLEKTVGGKQQPTSKAMMNLDRISKPEDKTIGPAMAETSSGQAPPPDPDADPPEEPIPVMIRQPQTRDISHDQLVVEVKGIYAGLVMVEAKCIDVDEKQTAAARDKATARRTRPTDEQWGAQITLHKTLLHEHHDFFLASQHPKASPALKKMAATYQMPARMWRHGVHAFLEVLRHRLPESLDHMLAFISIAYAMVTLLVETVPTFENTWIECLGDLGRYRMAIEDNDMRDRETFAGVSRFWYSKASYRNPHIGRLYHHLAILSRPFSLQQLSFYTRSLTSITPFQSARGTVMNLFNPILDGRAVSSSRTTSFESRIIKAHAMQFRSLPQAEHRIIVGEIRNGSMTDHVLKVTSKFREQGVYLATANIAAVFEYGVLRSDGVPKAAIWLALCDEILHDQSLHDSTQSPSITTPDATEQSEPRPKVAPRTGLSVDDLTPKELEASSSNIFDAASLWSVCFSTALQFPRNPNYHPFLHVMFVFLWSLTGVARGITYVEGHVPWDDVCFFLNTFSKSEATEAKVEGEDFPQPDEGVGRPLPEDYVLRGQLYSWCYFPDTWFSKAKVDDEERVLELPSMVAPRLERIRWLGARIAARNRWIRFDPETRKFGVTEVAREIRTQTIQQTTDMAKPLPSEIQDKEMTDAPSEVAAALASTEGKPKAEATGNVPVTDQQSLSPRTHEQPTEAEQTITVSWLQGNVLDQAKGPPRKRRSRADPLVLEGSDQPEQDVSSCPSA